MQTEILRSYPFPDAVMLGYSKKVGAYLASDLAEFTLFDVTINEEYLAGFQNLLTGAETDVSDDVIIDQQVQLTN